MRSLGAALSHAPLRRRELPARRASFLPCLLGRCGLSESDGPLDSAAGASAALRLCGPTGHWSTRGVPSPGRGPPLPAPDARRSHTAWPTQSRPLRNPSLPAEAARVTLPRLPGSLCSWLLSPHPPPPGPLPSRIPHLERQIPRRLMVLMLL